MSRVRISIGQHLLYIAKGIWNEITSILIGVAIVVASIALMCPNLGASEYLSAQPNASAPPKLVIAQGRNWRTDYFETSSAAADQLRNVATCNLRTWILPAGGALRVPDVGLWQCGTPQEFYLLDVPGGTAFTFLRFDDGVTNASYAVPPVGAVTLDQAVTVGPVVVDRDFVTAINTWPARETQMIVELFDGAGEKIGISIRRVKPPVDQLVLADVFDVSVGSLRIEIVPDGVGCIGCAPPPPLYGFVAVTDRRGGNARVIAFPVR